uniref:Uncharacterized protein n=1 Tax=Romanomermis culicivorax TaxID=13658 RepID=A0A915HXJ8_ROMCU
MHDLREIAVHRFVNLVSREWTRKIYSRPEPLCFQVPLSENGTGILQVVRAKGDSHSSHSCSLSKSDEENKGIDEVICEN